MHYVPMRAECREPFQVHYGKLSHILLRMKRLHGSLARGFLDLPLLLSLTDQ